MILFPKGVVGRLILMAGHPAHEHASAYAKVTSTDDELNSPAPERSGWACLMGR